MIKLQLHVAVQKPSISELHAPGTDNKTDTVWSSASYPVFIITGLQSCRGLTIQSESATSIKMGAF